MFLDVKKVYAVQHDVLVTEQLLNEMKADIVGDGSCGLLILFDDTQSKILEKKADEQLDKILQFLKVNKASVSIFNTASRPFIDLPALLKVARANRLLAFGVPAGKIGWTDKLAMNEYYEFSNLSVIKTHSLQHLADQPGEKKLLANALRAWLHLE